ncbi:hypothetical protein EXS71_04195 [Candidatus Uhrbacteria bacterium]|nr:hypothetical protein [Candidatus Uhrbacteria bacterium]
MNNFISTVVAPVQNDSAIVAAYEALQGAGHVLEIFEEAAWMAAVLRIEERQHSAAVQADPAVIAVAAERTAAAIAEVEARMADRKEEAFQNDRKKEAVELFRREEFDVAIAIRGEVKGAPVSPRWAAGILRVFLARITRVSRFHDVVVETLKRATTSVAQEDAEVAKAESIRQEAKKRQEANRRDRAACQSRFAKGGKKS